MTGCPLAKNVWKPWWWLLPSAEEAHHTHGRRRAEEERGSWALVSFSLPPTCLSGSVCKVVRSLTGLEYHLEKLLSSAQSCDVGGEPDAQTSTARSEHICQTEFYEGRETAANQGTRDIPMGWMDVMPRRRPATQRTHKKRSNKHCVGS